jgi:hypothetical protein
VKNRAARVLESARTSFFPTGGGPVIVKIGNPANRSRAAEAAIRWMGCGGKNDLIMSDCIANYAIGQYDTLHVIRYSSRHQFL